MVDDTACRHLRCRRDNTAGRRSGLWQKPIITYIIGDYSGSDSGCRKNRIDGLKNHTTDTGFDLNDLLAKTGKQSDWKSFGDSLLYALSKQLDMAVGIVFKCTDDEFSPAATFAYYSNEAPHSFKMGEGLSGQVAKDKKPMFLNELPSKSLVIVSGLGQIEVNNLAIIPILKDDNAVGLIEIATFKPFENGFVNKIDEISNAIGGVTPQ